MSYAEGYLADPLTTDDMLKRILEDTKRGNEPVPPYLTAKDVRCMVIDLQRLRFAAWNTRAIEATRPTEQGLGWQPMEGAWMGPAYEHGVTWGEDIMHLTYPAPPSKRGE